MARRTVADHIREQVRIDLLERLARITDPIQRAHAAHEAIAAAGDLRKHLVEARAEAARAMAANGMTWVSIGKEFGVSGVRAKGMAEGRDRSWG